MRRAPRPFRLAALAGLAALPGWAAPRSLLYVDNTAGEEITMVDTATDQVVGNIAVGPAPHGLAVSPDGRWLYVSSEGRDELLAVDTATATVAWRRPLSARPNEISLSPDGRYVFVPIRGSNLLEVVDTRARRTVARIQVGAAPHNSYRSPDGRWIYCTSMGDDNVAIVDIATRRNLGVIPLPGQPRPLAITADNRFLYVQLTGLHGFVVADVAARKVVGKVELPPADVAAVSAFGYTPSHGIGLRPGHAELWANNVYGDSVEIFSVPEHRLLGSVPVGGEPDWMDFSADGSRLYVSNPETNDVSVIDCERRVQLARVKVGLAPKRVLCAEIPDCREDSAGWRAAAARPASTDYLLKDGGAEGCDLSGFRGQIEGESLPLEAVPAYFRRLGIVDLEIDCSLLPSDNPARLGAFAAALRREGRRLAAVDLDADFADVAADRAQASVEEARRALACARDLGAPLVCLRLRAGGEAELALGVRQLLNAAREAGTRLALEPGPGVPAAEILSVIHATDPLWVGACVDVAVDGNDAGRRALIGALGPSALLVHAECRAYDRWGNESSIDYHNLLPLLGKLSYGGDLSIRYVGGGDPARATTDLRDLLVKEWLGRGVLPKDPAVASSLLKPSN